MMEVHHPWKDLKNRRVKYCTGACGQGAGQGFAGILSKQEGSQKYLIDWEDGSTSKVCVAEGVNIAAALKSMGD